MNFVRSYGNVEISGLKVKYAQKVLLLMAMARKMMMVCYGGVGRGGRRHVKYPLSSIAPAVAQLRSAWHDLI